MRQATLARNERDAMLDVLNEHTEMTDVVSVEIVAKDNIEGTDFNVYAVETTTQAVRDGENVME